MTWEFESEIEPSLITEKILTRLSDLNPTNNTIRVEKQKCSKNVVLGDFTPDEVLNYVSNDEEKREYKVGEKSYFVRMNSHRYFVFRSNRKCVACGLEGEVMRLERHPFDKSPHFNFYALQNDKLILMTKDHIHAKSNGGEDCLSNYQTMCCVCNNLKGSDNLTISEIAQLRETYNQYSQKLTKKKLNAKMRLVRCQLMQEKEEEVQNMEKYDFLAKCDIMIIRDNHGELQGVSAYEAVKEDQFLACVKKGSPIFPLKFDKKQLLVAFNEEFYRLFFGYVEI